MVLLNNNGFVICLNSVNRNVQKSQDHSADILEIPISAKGRQRKEENTMGEGREEKKEADASVNVSKLFHIQGDAIVKCKFTKLLKALASKHSSIMN